ncbi:Nup85 nucleoporin-domain-containing protein [Ochromonadaceae sp. CCMP2298]|nr:Nup85 nucleoporin-domain-containing protein [Ochromonadaceae sp. CCMP2298]
MQQSASDPLSCSCRKFIFDSFAVFQRIPQNVDPQFLGDEIKLEILRCSAEFRSHLRALAAEVSEIAESQDSSSSRTNPSASLDQEYYAVHSMEKSWHVCEVFLLNPTKLLSIEFVRWLREVCCPLPLDVFVEQLLNADQPELITGAGSSWGYWELVYQLVLQGSLGAASALLQAHSEIQAALESGGMQGLAGASISRAQCLALFEVLASHPFAALTADAGVLDTAASIASEFSSWQQRVAKLRQSNNALLTSVPELDTVLRALLGEASTLEQLSRQPMPASEGFHWARLCVGMLLYVHPPPLHRGDLGRVVEQCVRLSDAPLSGLEMGYVRVLREVMTGNVAPTLRSLFELRAALSSSGSIGSPRSRVLSMVPLLCTAHLSLLLVVGTDKEDLLVPLPESAHETSFFEEVFLEAACALNALEQPLELVLGYLGVCASRGRDCARLILPVRALRSDREALAVADVLFDLDLPEEAASLFLRRAHWLLQRNPAFPLPPAGTGADVGGTVAGRGRASTLAKAASFYCLAGDALRLRALLESSLSRCAWAVVGCCRVFPGLRFLPGTTSLSEPCREAGARSDEDSELELQGALLEAVELLQTVDVAAVAQHRARRRAPSPTSASVAVVEAEGQALGESLRALRLYVQAVQMRFADPASEAGPMDEQGGAGPHSTALLEAAALLGDIITSPSGPALSIRYWLHILELVAWYAELVSRLEGSGAPGSAVDSGAGAGAGVVFSKAGAYLLLAHLEEAAGCYGSEALLQVRSGGADFDGKDSAEGSLRALRLSLLGVLSSAVVAENARRGERGAGEGVWGAERWVASTAVSALQASGVQNTAGRRPPFGGDAFALPQFVSAADSRERRKLGACRSLQEQEAYEMLSGASLAFL